MAVKIDENVLAYTRASLGNGYSPLSGYDTNGTDIAAGIANTAAIAAGTLTAQTWNSLANAGEYVGLDVPKVNMASMYNDFDNFVGGGLKTAEFYGKHGDTIETLTGIAGMFIPGVGTGALGARAMRGVDVLANTGKYTSLVSGIAANTREAAALSAARTAFATGATEKFYKSMDYWKAVAQKAPRDIVEGAVFSGMEFLLQNNLSMFNDIKDTGDFAKMLLTGGAINAGVGGVFRYASLSGNKIDDLTSAGEDISSIDKMRRVLSGAKESASAMPNRVEGQMAEFAQLIGHRLNEETLKDSVAFKTATTRAADSDPVISAIGKATLQAFEDVSKIRDRRISELSQKIAESSMHMQTAFTPFEFEQIIKNIGTDSLSTILHDAQRVAPLTPAARDTHVQRMHMMGALADGMKLENQQKIADRIADITKERSDLLAEHETLRKLGNRKNATQRARFAELTSRDNLLEREHTALRGLGDRVTTSPEYWKQITDGAIELVETSKGRKMLKHVESGRKVPLNNNGTLGKGAQNVVNTWMNYVPVAHFDRAGRRIDDTDDIIWGAGDLMKLGDDFRFMSVKDGGIFVRGKNGQDRLLGKHLDNFEEASAEDLAANWLLAEHSPDLAAGYFSAYTVKRGKMSLEATEEADMAKAARALEMLDEGRTPEQIAKMLKAETEWVKQVANPNNGTMLPLTGSNAPLQMHREYFTVAYNRHTRTVDNFSAEAALKWESNQRQMATEIQSVVTAQNNGFSKLLNILPDSIAGALQETSATAGKFFSYSTARAASVQSDMLYIGHIVEGMTHKAQKDAADRLSATARALAGVGHNSEQIADLHTTMLALRKLAVEDGRLVYDKVAGHFISEKQMKAIAKDPTIQINGIKFATREAEQFYFQFNGEMSTLAREASERADVFTPTTRPGKIDSDRFIEVHLPRQRQSKDSHVAAVRMRADAHAATGDGAAPSFIYAKSADELKAKVKALQDDAEFSALYTVDSISELSARMRSLSKNTDDFRFDPMDVNVNEHLERVWKNPTEIDYTTIRRSTELVNDMVGQVTGRHAWNVRDQAHKLFGRQISELQNAAAQELRIANSSGTSVLNTFKESLYRPTSKYDALSRTMLGLPQRENSPLWSSLQAQVEDAIDAGWKKLVHPLIQSYVDSGLAKNNRGENFIKALEEGYTKHNLPMHRKFDEEMLKGTPLFESDPKIARRLVQATNTLYRTTMLGLDPFNWIANATGTALYKGALISTIRHEMGLTAQQYEQVQSHGIVEAIKQLRSQDFRKKFYDAGIVHEATEDIYRLRSDLADMNGILLQKDITAPLKLKLGDVDKASPASWFSYLNQRGADLVEKAQMPGRWIENETELIGAAIGYNIGKTLGMSEERAMSMSLHFANSTRGARAASQRPGMFSGPVGQAYGLFQSFSLNMMQQMSRFMENGDRRALLMLGASQTGLFGMQGLPGYNFIGQNLMRSLTNDEHDLTSKITQLIGSDGEDGVIGPAAKFALFGGISSVLQADIYRRGDMNPHMMGPINPWAAQNDNPLQLPPALAAIGKTFTQMKQIGADGFSKESVEFAINQNAWNRPLRGVAEMIIGAGPLSAKNTPVFPIGTYNLSWYMGALRAAGGRDLDEAIAMDALYRHSAYSSEHSRKLQELGTRVRMHLLSDDGELTADKYEKLAEEYTKLSGTDRRAFDKYVKRQQATLNRGQMDAVAARMRNNPHYKGWAVSVGADE